MVSCRPASGSLEQPVCQPCRRELGKRICAQCGQEFQAEASTSARPFCSQKCFIDSIRLYDDPRAASKASTRARKTQHRKTWDGVTDQQILKRDEWACQIPGCELGPIQVDMVHPHPLSPSIDHIVPLSRGGDDTQANKCAAHLACNVRRGNAVHDGEPRVVRTLAPARKPETVHLCAVCTAAPVRKAGATCVPCRHAARDAVRGRALAMRADGMEWKQVADVLGLSGPGAAYNVAYPPWDRYDFAAYTRRDPRRLNRAGARWLYVRPGCHGSRRLSPRLVFKV